MFDQEKNPAHVCPIDEGEAKRHFVAMATEPLFDYLFPERLQFQQYEAKNLHAHVVLDKESDRCGKISKINLF